MAIIYLTIQKTNNEKKDLKMTAINFVKNNLSINNFRINNLSRRLSSQTFNLVVCPNYQPFVTVLP